MNEQPIRIRPLRDPVIKVKKTHPDAVLPVANNKEPGTGDTGFDLVSIEDKFIPSGGSAVVGVGLTLADISPGYWIRIEPRSGLGFKHNIQPHLGVIDNGYRGDLGVKLYNFSDPLFDDKSDGYNVKSGDKIAQLVVYPLIQPQFELAEEVTETSRGAKGFGSSDNSTDKLSPDMQDIKEKVLRVKSSDDWWSYADAYTKEKLESGEYIPNPMKVDQSDPDYIPNPDYKKDV